MTELTSKPAATDPVDRSEARDGLLHAAFAIFAGAMGAVLILVLEVEPEIAALAALSCLSILVAINAIMRRASLIAAFDAEIADLKAELANLKGRSQHKSFASPVKPETLRPISSSAMGGATTGQTPIPVSVATPSLDARPPAIAPGAPEAPPSLIPSQLDPIAATVSAPVIDTPPPSLSSASNLSHDGPITSPKPARDAGMMPDWTLRPGAVRARHLLPGLDDGPTLPTAVPPAAPMVEAATVSAGTSDAARHTESGAALDQWPRAAPKATGQALDLATMQSLIEQLAVQLNQPRSADDEPETVAASIAPPQPGEAPRPVLASAEPQAHWQTSTAIAGRTSVRRLPQTPASMAPLGRLALIAEAVEANRMDVYLDPILGLTDRKARHFELSVRLLTETGSELGASDYLGPAGGTGLLARIDSAKLARAAEVAQKLKRRGSRASLFSNIAGESLADETFIGAFADILDAEEGLGAKLVLTFTQADARAFTGAHWESISAMAQIGLKFALEDVRDLDMDFALLRHHGFDFVKLDAAVFLDGLPTPSGHIPAVDICRHLSQLGLGLIVGGIVAERDLAKILGFGALLGQGALFGAPRSVQLDVERRAA